MKKLILVFICLLLIVSCGFENLPPKALVVKGNPGLYVPIGSPFAGMKEEDKLEYLISTNNLKKMMNEKSTGAGAENEAEIYETSKIFATKLEASYPDKNLNIDPEVRSYLVHYPLMEMQLNLKKYADSAMETLKANRVIEIPIIPVGSTTPLFIHYNDVEKNTYFDESDDIDKPFMKIPLSKMAKMVKIVEGNKYGLEINYTQDLADNLWLKIPGFGVNDYMQGIPAENNTKLQYYDTSVSPKENFYPQMQMDMTPSDLDNERNLRIYAKITGPCPGTLRPVMIFDWKRALIDTESTDDISTFMGSYPIKNNLSEFLGEGVTFKKITGFVYMYGKKEEDAITSSITLSIYDTEEFDNNYRYPADDIENTLKDNLVNIKLPPLKDEFDDELAPMSLKNGPMDLTKIFDNINTTLQFAIHINDMWYDNDNNIDDQSSIKYDLLILIPLDMKVINPPPANAGADIQNKYVMLDLGETFRDKPLWDGDLFGRKEGEKNQLKGIEYFKIGIFKTNINITYPEKLAILAVKKGSRSENAFMKFENNASLKLAGGSSDDELLYCPEFSVLLERDKEGNTYKDFGSFKILRPQNPSFDFKLFVEAKAKLEYTMDF